MKRELHHTGLYLSQTVDDFDRWYAAFKDQESARRDAGIQAHHINHARDDSRSLTVFLAVGDVEAAKKMFEADDISDSQFVWVRPMTQNIVWHQVLPAVTIALEVQDINEWHRAFEDDGADSLRTSLGIVGYAANLVVNGDQKILVYYQAETFEDLDAVLADQRLREEMNSAGVSNMGDVAFTTGGWGKSYS